MVEGHILLETLEGKLFAPEVLERSEGQLASALVMKAIDNSVRTKQPIQIGFLKLGIHRIPHAQVCVDHGTGPNKRQKDLAVFAHGTGKDGPPEFIPAVPAITELHILPDSVVFNVSRPKIQLPLFGVNGSHQVGDVVIELAGANVSNPQFLKDPVELLVHKSAVHSKDDGYISLVPLTDCFYQAPDHPFDALSGIAVYVTGAENAVSQITFPGHLQGVEALAFFVCWPDMLPLFCIVVIHNHGIDVQDHSFRLIYSKPPYKNPQMELAEKKSQRQGEGSEKSLDAMGRDHMSFFGFNDSRAAKILFYLSK